MKGQCHTSSGASDIFHIMTLAECYSTPSEQDYYETMILFRDFCLPPTTIPPVKTKNQLVSWRTHHILRYLENPLQ